MNLILSFLVGLLGWSAYPVQNSHLKKFICCLICTYLHYHLLDIIVANSNCEGIAKIKKYCTDIKANNDLLVEYATRAIDTVRKTEKSVFA